METLEVKKRDAVGSRAVKRLRWEGKVPAILYGHGEENVNLCVTRDALGKLIRHGSKLLSLTGDVQDTALLREVQWDPFGIEVIHVDFARVSQTEAVEITLPVELQGEAPGLGEGGQLKFVTHELTILCPAGSIPDHILVGLSGLHLGQSIHANEVKLPEGASMVTPGMQVVAQIVKPMTEEELLASTAVSAEPELIRREKSEEEEEKK